MTDYDPHNLPIYKMSEWPIEEAESAIAEYVKIGPAAIDWLERQMGRSLDGREGLDAAWAWTVDAIRAQQELDLIMVAVALEHLMANEAMRREPRLSWGRYDHRLRKKILGYNAPAIRAEGVEGAQMIPAQRVANIIGRVETSTTRELEARYRDALNDDALSVNVDNFIESLHTNGLLEARCDRDAGQHKQPDSALEPRAAAPDRVVRVPDDEVDGDEGWERLRDDQPELRNVEAIREGSGWQVHVWVAEYVREDPLESELRQRMTQALQAVPGVTSVIEEDREIWSVEGNLAGNLLVQAAAEVVDDLAERTSACVYGELD